MNYFYVDSMSHQTDRSQLISTYISKNYVRKLFIFFVLCLFLITNLNINSIATEVQLTKKIYSDHSDGISKFLGRPDEHTWDQVRNSPIGNQKNDTMNVYYKGILSAYNEKQGGIYVISRSYFAFNTSFLKITDTIQHANLSLYGIGTNESRVSIVSWTDGEDGIDFDDYGYIGAELFGLSEHWKINTYNRISLNTKGISYINKDGQTYLCCREYNHDFLNQSPYGNRLAEYRNGHYFSDELGIEKDPYLQITYTQNSSDSDNDPNQNINENNSPFASFLLVLVIFLFIGIIKKKTYD